MEVWGGNQAIDRNIVAPGLRIWAFCKPFGESKSGGDVYYLSSCASGRITRMLLADVSGHGHMVSNIAISLRDLMRRNVNYIKQTRFVKSMNKQFSECHVNGEFATAIVSTFFSPTKKLTICNAGHPPPLHYRAQMQAWRELSSEFDWQDKIADTPLGIVADAGYSQHEIQLEPGDFVLMFSDAISESEDRDGNQLGCGGVLKLVAEVDASLPAQIIPSLLDRIAEMKADNLHQDDVTLLLIQATGDGPSLKANLLAPFRFLGSVKDSTAFS